MALQVINTFVVGSLGIIWKRDNAVNALLKIALIGVAVANIVVMCRR